MVSCTVPPGAASSRIQSAHRAPMRVNLDIRAAGPAAQVRLIGRFDPGFAQKIVVEDTPCVFVRFPFVAVDPAHRSQQMRGQRAVRIPADRLRLGADTGQERLVFFDLRHGRHRHIQRDPQGVIRVLLGVGDGLLDFVRRDVEQRGQPAQSRRVFGDVRAWHKWRGGGGWRPAGRRAGR